MPTEATVSEVIRSRIRIAMVKADVQQQEVAAATGLGQQSLSKRMTGVVRWSVDDLIYVAKYLGVPVSELLPDTIVDATP